MTDNIKAQAKSRQAKSRSEVTNDLLQEVKGKFDEVVIVGVKNGEIDIATSVPTYHFCQYMLSRGAFKLNISEEAQMAADKQTPTVEVPGKN